MKNIIDLCNINIPNSLHSLYEDSLLADVEDTLARGEDDIMRTEIERKLQNDSIYYFHYSKVNQKPYTIKKVRGKWVVDALGDLTVYGVADNGCVTDGTFSFGTVNGNYIISMPASGGDKLKSLQYGPIEVRDDFDIYYGGGLKDLHYCPKTVHGWVNVSGTQITTLKYFPSFVGGNACIRDNKELKSVKDLRKCKVDGYLIFKGNGISGPSVITNFANKWNILFSQANVIEGQEMTSEASILGDLEDTINSGNKEVDKFTQFGKLFSFDQIQFASDSTAVFFNAPTLKRLTKGMNYINDKINIGWFDSKQKIKMFLNWLDHISFENLDIDYKLLRDTSSEEFRQKLAKSIQVYGKDCEVFTPKYHVQVYCPSTKVTGRDELRLMFNEYPGYKSIQVKYKINK